VWAVAAIARPDAFFAMLRDAGLSLAGTTALPDHAAFDAAPWSRPDAHTLVCTEKDAMKLWLHRPDAWAVPLVLDVPPGFWSRLDTLLASHTLAKLSSPHGHTTA
jgi:tetraacyldisaccharide 4'-kinase